MHGTFLPAAMISLLVPASLLPCSAIAVVKDGKVVLGANNDYSHSLVMKLRTVPARNGEFGRVCLSMDNAPFPDWTPIAGRCMNDQGLAIAHANVPKGPTPFDPDKPQFRHNFVEKIVAECATVKQAVSMLQAYTLPERHGAFIHIMVADAAGDAAVIEWADGAVKVVRTPGPVQFMTNSLLSKPGTEGPNSRFSRGTRMLPEVKDASPASVVPVLREISVYARFKGQEVGTLDTTVWDVTGRKLQLFFKRDFDHPLVFDLDEELAKGPRTTDLKTLFPNPVAFERGWRDENGPVPAKPVK